MMSRIFNEMVTAADRDIHYSTLLKDEHFKSIYVYGNYRSEKSEKITYCGTLDKALINKLPLKSYKLNLIIPHRNWINGVTQRTLDIMAAGGFIIEPYMKDLCNMFVSLKSVLYTDEFSMMSRSIYYLNHPTERVDIVNEIIEEISRKHTYEHRINEILSYI